MDLDILSKETVDKVKLSHWLTLTSFITAILLAWSLREIIIQIFAGIIIAMALCTLTGKVSSLFSMPRALALVLTLILVLFTASISLVIIIPQFTQEFQQLLIQLPSAARGLIDLFSKSINEISVIIYGQSVINENGLFSNELYAFPDGSTLANGVTDSLRKLFGLASNLGLGIVQFVFIFSVSLMITVQPIAYREVFILIVPSFYRSRLRIILLKCGDALSSWMTGVLISSTFVAFLAGIGLYFLGVKLVIANALIAGILNVIPNVGPTLSTIFPMSVAFLDTPWKSLAVLGLYIIIQNLESYLITPSVMQKQVKLLPGLTLTAQFVFTIIFGPMGLLLALPLAVVIQVLTKEILISDILEKGKNSNFLR
tara:strand:- start:854 stop:1966 length:1113 start_codon:yes stop_codon:yes gene_type:complete